jgi:hypothetical protein
VVGEEEEEGIFLAFFSLATCHVLFVAAKKNCGGCLLLNAYRVLEGSVHHSHLPKSIYPSIHPPMGYITLYNSPFLDEFIITR